MGRRLVSGNEKKILGNLLDYQHYQLRRTVHHGTGTVHLIKLNISDQRLIALVALLFASLLADIFT
jgi:hypothetical protein